MKELLIFVAGAAVGVGATIFIMKKKTNEEITTKVSEFQEMYRKKLEDAGLANFEKPNNDINEKAKANLMKDYNTIVTAYNGVKDNEDKVIADTQTQNTSDYIYPISPDEFANSNPNYEKTTLQFYTDEILADMDGVPVNSTGTIGDDFVNQFDMFEHDVVYIRNDKLLTDYEVLREAMSYEDYYGISDD